jgi:ATP-dependent DNA ligase
VLPLDGGTVDLPLTPPIAPMLAKLARELPVGDLLYEPKWDGFRCLLFRDGPELLLQSRAGKPLDRYFPEVGDPLRELLPEKVVLDGELVVPVGDRLDFDALSNRVHPAASRVELLARETPARYVAFDVLAAGDEDLTGTALRDRRGRLETILEGAEPPLHLSPATTDPRLAADWFTRFEGAGFDGVIAKPFGDGYASGKRTLHKVKHLRTADCVVAGFRLHKDGEGVGSLLLGLYDDAGTLVNVGVASSFAAPRRRELLEELAPHRPAAGEVIDHPWIDPDAAEDGTGRTPRGEHRWSGQRDGRWEPLRLELVAEVAYEQLQRDRFRHMARFQRWRPDRDVASCRYDQLEEPPPAELQRVFDLHRS